MNPFATGEQVGTLRDIQPLVTYSAQDGGFFWLALVLILATVIAGVIFWYWRRRLAQAPSLSPRTQLLRSLAELSESSRQKDVGAFYQQLSFSLKTYLGNITGISALDQTTSELDVSLRATPEMFSKTVDAVIDILKRSDDVKFARLSVEQEMMSMDLKTILDWVTQETPTS